MLATGMNVRRDALLALKISQMQQLLMKIPLFLHLVQVSLNSDKSATIPLMYDIIKCLLVSDTLSAAGDLPTQPAICVVSPTLVDQMPPTAAATESKVDRSDLTFMSESGT